MIYSNLLINDKNWNHLTHSWIKQKLPHAILFHGPEGSGKEGHAIELAALIQCNSDQTTNSCGKCISCKKTKSLKHNNIKLIIPLARGKIKSRNDSIEKAFSESTLSEYWDLLKQKEEDPYFSIKMSGSNTILINSIRELKHELSLSNLNNEWKIILIFEAEKLCIPSPESAHAILKILEEPPENTLFILVSSKPGAILDTIRSRCQSLYFPPISNQILTDYLIKSGSDSIQAHLMARISGGDVKLSKKLVMDSVDLMEKLFIILNACFTNNPEIWNSSIDIMAKQKISDINRWSSYFFVLYFFLGIYFIILQANLTII